MRETRSRSNRGCFSPDPPGGSARCVGRERLCRMFHCVRAHKMPSSILCMALIAAMALFTIGCNGSTAKNAPSGTGTGANIQTESEVLGEGSTVFTLTVVDKEGNETPFEIHTEKETVGEALLELELIAGEEGKYGLYVKTVNGITIDYDKDGVYWAFYVNGEYALSGVDSTKITEGETYSFRAE